VVVEAIKEVAGPTFFALLGSPSPSCGADSAIRGRADVQAAGLYQDSAMLVAALLAITLDPLCASC